MNAKTWIRSAKISLLINRWGGEPMNRIVGICFIGFAIFIGTLVGLGHAAASAEEELRPLITTSELVVGSNRFAFGLLKDNKLIDGAEVTLRIFAVDGERATLTAELNAPYHAVINLKQESSVHRHQDGTKHIHGEEAGVRGLYVASLSFSRAGTWGIELLAQAAKGTVETVRFAVEVLDAPATPAVGSAAPRSRNLIASDVKKLREIDTSPKPDARLHQVRIADAIKQGKPQLIVFATPQFCTSRMCGPVVDIVRSLYPAYRKSIAFTHQEIWQDFAEKKMFPTVDEWRLDTEPWVFVVDGVGIIRAKFEGLVIARELESALQQFVPLGPARRQ
jgi:hypothetical protein